MLRIKRDKMFVDMMREYKVFIDGKFVGTVENGETVGFELDEGHHLVHLEIDWCRSKKLSLDVKSGENVVLHTGSSMKWFLFPFMYLLKLSLLKDSYIALKQEKELIGSIEEKYNPEKEVNLRKLQTISF